MCAFLLPPFFSPLAISGTALQEGKLVGICALPLPSLGAINMQRLSPGQGPFPLFPQGHGRSSWLPRMVPEHCRDVWAECAALEEEEDQDGFMLGLCWWC